MERKGGIHFKPPPLDIIPRTVDTDMNVQEPVAVKISRTLFQLKELLGLVVYKGDNKDGANQSLEDSSSSQIAASSSLYKLADTNIRSLAVDLNPDKQ